MPAGSSATAPTSGAARCTGSTEGRRSFAAAVRLISAMMCCLFMFAVALGDVLNFNIRPMFFEVFGNETAVAVVRLFLAAKQAATIQNLA